MGEARGPRRTLATRAWPPGLPPDAIARPRLRELLTPTAGVRVVALVAPAGWGKTTSLAEWASVSTNRVAWLAMGPEDADPGSFMRGLVAALEVCIPGTGDAAAAMASDRAPQFLEALAQLLSDLERGAGSTALDVVLDDAQHAVHGETCELVRALLRRVPAPHRVLLASRDASGLGLERLVAEGRARTVAVDDLAFTREEARAFAPRLSERSARDLAGWPAALRLERARPDEERRWTDPGSDLQRYVRTEVIETLPPETRDLAVRLSVLETFDLKAVSALSGPVDAGGRLDRLLALGLFVTPLGPDGDGHRFHDLFRDALGRELAQWGEREVEALQHAAMEHCFKEDRPDEAVEHGLRARAFRRVAEHLEESLASRIMEGRGPPSRWWAALPAEILDDRPLLQAHVLMDIVRSQPGVDLSVELARLPPPGAIDNGPALEVLLRGLHIHQAFLHEDVPSIVEHAVAAANAAAGGHDLYRVNAASYLQSAYRFSGQPALAERAVAELRTMTSWTHRPAESLRARTVLGFVEMMRGHFTEAARAFEGALSVSRKRFHADSPIIAPTHQGLGYVRFEQNRLTEALIHLQKAADLALRLGGTSTLSGVYRVLASVLARMGNAAEARVIFAKLEALNAASRASWSEDYLAAAKAALALDLGDLATVRRWLKERAPNVGEMLAGGRPYLLRRSLVVLTAARALMGVGRSGEAATLATALADAAEQGERRWFAVRARAVQAMALAKTGRRSLAIEAVAEAVSGAAAASYVRALADEGLEMASLLKERGRGSLDPEYWDGLLDACSVPSGTAPSIPLTPREREILTVVSTGATDKAAAARLGVSVSTVKTHLRSVFRKLDVSNRTQAVARAESFELLDR